jgi:hypothetical protein
MEKAGSRGCRVFRFARNTTQLKGPGWRVQAHHDCPWLKPSEEIEIQRRQADWPTADSEVARMFCVRPRVFLLRRIEE